MFLGRAKCVVYILNEEREREVEGVGRTHLLLRVKVIIYFIMRITFSCSACAKASDASALLSAVILLKLGSSSCIRKRNAITTKILMIDKQK